MVKLPLSWLPYEGAQRTFVSDLSVAECLRRLHQDVIDDWELPQLTHGLPFKRQYQLDQAHLVFREVKEDQFRLFSGRDLWRFEWRFDGTVTQRGGTTTIVGRHRMDRLNKTLFYAGIIAPGCLCVVVGAVAIISMIASWQINLIGLLLNGFFVVVGLALLVTVPTILNQQARRNEAYVVAFLARFLAAREAASTRRVDHPRWLPAGNQVMERDRSSL